VSKKLFVIGDSLCCSRPSEGVHLKDLYFNRIQDDPNLDIVIIDRAKPANTISSSFIEPKIQNDLMCDSYDYLLIHLGIVDCFPRNIYERYYNILSPFENFRGIAWALKCFRTYLGKRRHKHYKKHKPFVTLEMFEKYLNDFIKTAKLYNSHHKVILITICLPGSSLLEKNPGIKEIILKYNRCIKKVAKTKKTYLIDCEKYKINEYLLEDGHHLSQEGHIVLFKILKNLLLDSR
jgi:hypothetical protein